LEPEQTQQEAVVEESLPSTPTGKCTTSLLAKSLNTSPSTAALIQKSNGTPTTSILKKRLIEAKTFHSGSKKMLNISSSVLFGEDITPNKRRFAFLEKQYFIREFRAGLILVYLLV